MRAPGTDDQPSGAGFARPTNPPQPSAAGLGCLLCDEPLDDPDYTICLRCTEETLQSEIHQ